MATITVAKQGALSSALGAIASIGTATTKIIDASAKSADFLDNLVEASLADQQERYALERKEKSVNRLMEYAQRRSETQIRVLQFCDQKDEYSDVRRKIFENSLQEYAEVLNIEVALPTR